MIFRDSFVPVVYFFVVSELIEHDLKPVETFRCHW